MDTIRTCATLWSQSTDHHYRAALVDVALTWLGSPLDSPDRACMVILLEAMSKHDQPTRLREVAALPPQFDLTSHHNRH